MKIYKYLLLDWDGCLADTLSVWMNAYINSFEHFYLYPTKEQIAKVAFGDYDGPLKLGLKKEDKNLFDEIMPKHLTGLLTVPLHPNVKDTLIKLRERGVLLAVVSSAKKDFIVPAMKHNGVEDMFDLLLDADDVTKHKPDPEVLFKAIDLLNINKDECLIVGDSIKDIEAANNAGVGSVLFYPVANRLFYDKNFLLSRSPSYFIEDFKKLLEIVQ